MALFTVNTTCPICGNPFKEDELVATSYGWKACKSCSRHITAYREETHDENSYSAWELKGLLADFKYSKPDELTQDAIFSIDGAYGKKIYIFENKCIINTDFTVGSILQGNATDGRKIIFYKDIIGIQFKEPGVFLGFIQFETAANIKNENSENFYSENAFVFSEITDEIQEMYKYVVNRTEEIKACEYSGSYAISPMNELKILKDLLDMDIVNQQEFDAKKKQLLNL